MADFWVHWLTTYGAMALFVLLTLGIFGVPVPNETLVTFAGVLVSRGELRFVPTWIASVLGAITGASFSYLLGRTTGLAVVHRYGKWLHVTTPQLDRVGEWLSRRGRWVLVFGYFIPGVRHLTGIVAGSTRLPFASFAVCAYSGAFLWATLFLLLGWYGSNEWQTVLRQLHRQSLIVVVVVIGAALVYAILRRLRARDTQFPPTAAG